MKQSIQSISVKKPCFENWEQMEIADKGRFCHSCQKNVIDFTRLTNDQILNQLSIKSHLCGRFEVKQLSQINGFLQSGSSRIISWKRWSVAVAFLTVSPFVKVQAQTKVKTEQIPYDTQRNIYLGNIDERKASGKVVDEQKIPLVGASISVKGTNIETIADLNGNFKIYVPVGYDTLMFKFIGYESQEIKIKETDIDNLYLQFITYTVLPQNEILAGAVFVKGSFIHRVWYYISHPIRSIFTH